MNSFLASGELSIASQSVFAFCLSKCQKMILKKICVPTVPKIFRSVTRNTLFRGEGGGGGGGLSSTSTGMANCKQAAKSI